MYVQQILLNGFPFVWTENAFIGYEHGMESGSSLISSDQRCSGLIAGLGLPAAQTEGDHFTIGTRRTLFPRPLPRLIISLNATRRSTH